VVALLPNGIESFQTASQGSQGGSPLRLGRRLLRRRSRIFALSHIASCPVGSVIPEGRAISIRSAFQSRRLRAIRSSRLYMAAPDHGDHQIACEPMTRSPI